VYFWETRGALLLSQRWCQHCTNLRALNQLSRALTWVEHYGHHFLQPPKVGKVGLAQQNWYSAGRSSIPRLSLSSGAQHRAGLGLLVQHNIRFSTIANITVETVTAGSTAVVPHAAIISLIISMQGSKRL
jgi:hypothetical protein